MRAALLPTPGDPFMLAYWLRNLETWREYVDEVVVLVNGGPIPEPVEGVRFVHVPYRIGHDGAIDRLLDLTEAEYVVLCEDDAYVRHPKAVGYAFDAIEFGDTDIIGSPRHEDYASSPVQVWPAEMGNDPAELRRGLWPAFLFARRADLTATDRLFGDRRWNVGERITGWRTVTAEDAAFVGIDPNFIHLDTFFGTTFQLRAMGLRIELIHHVRLYDAPAVEQWLAEDPPWFHVTGLSTLDTVLSGESLPDMDDRGGLWTRRLSWWWRTLATTGIALAPSTERRWDQLEYFRRRAGITDAALQKWDARFEPWVTWAEVAVPA